jgi:hypothetical protein
MEHLAGVFHQRIKGFVPPWNTYDRTTVQVLDELGFEFLSAGWEVCRSGTLPEVPRTCTLANARRAVEGALLFESVAPVLVIVFHPDDFQEFAFPPLPDEPPPFTNLAELKALLGWITDAAGIEIDALSNTAQATRNGASLRNPAELRLPSRVKVSRRWCRPCSPGQANGRCCQDRFGAHFAPAIGWAAEHGLARCAHQCFTRHAERWCSPQASQTILIKPFVKSFLL